MSDSTLTAPAEGQTVEAPAHKVGITPAAGTKVKNLLEQEGRDDLRLRVAVQPGGCSGLIYQLYFDERMLDGDNVVDYDGVEVIVDKMSVPYLEGATIDWCEHQRMARSELVDLLTQILFSIMQVVGPQIVAAATK